MVLFRGFTLVPTLIIVTNKKHKAIIHTVHTIIEDILLTFLLNSLNSQNTFLGLVGGFFLFSTLILLVAVLQNALHNTMIYLILNKLM
jgi:hypothetical protein